MVHSDTIAPTRGTGLLGIAALAWLGGLTLSSIIGQATTEAMGWNSRAVTGLGGPVGELAARSVGESFNPAPPLAAQLLFVVPLWIAFLGGVAYAAQGDATLARRLRIGWSARQVAIGVLAGLVSQFGLLLVVYQVLLRWLIDPDSIDDAARALTDQIRGPGDFALLILVVGFGAPIFEELFFRGLVYRGLEVLAPTWVAVAGSALIFAAVHFQMVQFAGLFVFGLVLGALVAWSGNLVASLWAHIAFNIATVVVLGVAVL